MGYITKLFDIYSRSNSESNVLIFKSMERFLKIIYDKKIDFQPLYILTIHLNGSEFTYDCFMEEIRIVKALGYNTFTAAYESKIIESAIQHFGKDSSYVDS